MIENRHVEPGMKFEHRCQDGTVHHVRTKMHKARGLIWVLDDKSDYDSPSSAGNVCAGHRVNGWNYWGIPGEFKAQRAPRIEFKVERSCVNSRHRTRTDGDVNLLCPSCKVGIQVGKRDLVVGYKGKA